MKVEVVKLDKNHASAAFIYERVHHFIPSGPMKEALENFWAGDVYIYEGYKNSSIGIGTSQILVLKVIWDFLKSKIGIIPGWSYSNIPVTLVAFLYNISECVISNFYAYGDDGLIIPFEGVPYFSSPERIKNEWRKPLEG